MTIIFITGGVRSGKSAYAEKYAIELYKKYQRSSLYYLASGVAFDEEMLKRIERHKEDRSKSNVQWKTIEVQDDFPVEMLDFNQCDVVVWDCITTWVTNVLYKTEQYNIQERQTKIVDYLNRFKSFITQWNDKHSIIIIVSNEVLDEPKSNFEEVDLFRKILGELHQWLVSVCDEAYEMDYSITKRWK
ncbi:adenosylcobinamide kinase /adenosylcobinamide-phosphate guanylyltransferase [Ureibacillus xyleni]|uniref:Adenosylcobinamide kinase n=1 Tax=Ureibacillus xyleni TaxID=614648 RepID=A0A285TG76_9BACL|nr:bifunctional adenosylcobinamide kinase/adenosylcobinamide-phosphate guanylyltransferase [Ureibacillus xyleni]SOC20967.1 adenosylcobinamide kinase /adenosylcobinamide-phosphate guanylyltransferase [Ureibacillus xyleni]